MCTLVSSDALWTMLTRDLAWQAAFYYAAACAPMGTTAFGKAANVIMAAGGNVTFYMVNRGSFAVRSPPPCPLALFIMRVACCFRTQHGRR